MHAVEASIQHYWPCDVWMASKTVVAVSGGPDSVALLHALWTLSDRKACLVVGHIDHGLRGAESDGDREFVRGLADSWQLPCEIVRLQDDRAVAGKTNEESLRKARHRHLRRMAAQHGAAWIATAHHADDVVETMLHRLLRGSGPRGLGAIAPIRPISSDLCLVHPLLSARRAEILAYLEQHHLEFRNDTSNASEAYTRNRIRHQLLPYLREFAGSPELDQRLWRAARQIREEHEFVDQHALRWLQRSSIADDSQGAEFAADAFAGTEWCVIREGLVHLWHDRRWPLQGMTSRHWDQLFRFLQAASTATHPRRLQLPGRIEVTMRRRRVRFFRPASSDD